MERKINTLTAENISLKNAQRETRNTRGSFKTKETSNPQNTPGEKDPPSRLQQARQEPTRMDSRDPTLERIIDDMREIKALLGIRRGSETEMPPPQTIRIGRNPNANKQSMTYVRAAKNKIREREDQFPPLEGHRRTRIITRTNRDTRERNLNNTFMTDTHNESLSETTDAGTWTDVSRRRRRGRIKNKPEQGNALPQREGLPPQRQLHCGKKVTRTMLNC